MKFVACIQYRLYGNAMREGILTQRCMTRGYMKCVVCLQKHMCFGLVLKGSHKVMYLMASRQEIRDTWIRGLRYALQMDHLAEQRNEGNKYP